MYQIDNFLCINLSAFIHANLTYKTNTYILAYKFENSITDLPDADEISETDINKILYPNIVVDLEVDTNTIPETNIDKILKPDLPNAILGLCKNRGDPSDRCIGLCCKLF